MSLRPLGRSAITLESCLCRRPRQLLSPARCWYPPHLRNGRAVTSCQWRRNYAQQVRGSWKEVRDEIDANRRRGFYQLMAMQGLISVKMEVADEMFQGFVANQNVMDSRDLALWLAEQYKVPLRDITSLALVTYRIPEAVDKMGRAPPSQHKPIAKEMLLGCSKAGDLLATLHILGAVLQSDSLSGAGELAGRFNRAEIGACFNMAGVLADKGHPEAMVIRGMFLEQEGKERQAQALYEAALERHADPSIESAQSKMEGASIAIPITPPWIALGTLLLQDSSAPSREQARKVFERGALKEDDPLAYYHLASFETKESANWLSYMTKAAASGHADAMFQLGTFYQGAGDERGPASGLKSSILADTQLARALNWLQEWRCKGPADLAIEWFDAAAERGHKPSMAKLIEVYEAKDETEKVMEILEKLAETPKSKSDPKEWTILAQTARQRLSTVRLGQKLRGIGRAP